VRFEEMMDLAEHGPDTYIGSGPIYPWGGLFGGQIVAQALRAAANTVDPAFRAHSLHAYFIRRGDATQTIRFDVDRVRNGRSFVTRSVTARQSGGAILQMLASFQRHQPTEQVQTAAFPVLPPPDDLPDDSWTGMMQRRRAVRAAGRAAGWLRMVQSNPDDPVLAACALAYLSDDFATDCVSALVDEPDAPRTPGVSLDHAIWFQAPLRGGEWQLHDFRADGLLMPRGLAVGHIFDERGDHVATVTQEVLLRPERAPHAERPEPGGVEEVGDPAR
jgi:acyl-CoA thioesterase-2